MNGSKTKMQDSCKFKRQLYNYIIAVFITMLVVCCNSVMAQSIPGHHSFLGGPWELVVGTDLDGHGLRFPIKVADEN